MRITYEPQIPNAETVNSQLVQRSTKVQRPNHGLNPVKGVTINHHGTMSVSTATFDSDLKVPEPINRRTTRILYTSVTQLKTCYI
jgi:hypothetical protein